MKKTYKAHKATVELAEIVKQVFPVVSDNDITIHSDEVVVDAYDSGYGFLVNGIVEVDEYGVAHYKVTVEQYDTNDEIPTAETITTHFAIDEDTELPSDDEVEQEIEKWEKRPKFKFNFIGTTIELESTIVEEVCHVSMTHTHYFKAIAITIEDTDLENVKAALTLSDILAQIYNKLVELAQK